MATKSTVSRAQLARVRAEAAGDPEPGQMRHWRRHAALRAGVAASVLLALVAPGCTRDEADAGEYGGSDDGGTSLCFAEPGEFDAALDWTAAENPGVVASFVPVHVAHLPPVGPDRDPTTARIFMMGGYLDQHMWDPLIGDFTNHLGPNVDFFCSGHAITPSGSLFLAGGGGVDEAGISLSYLFDRSANVGIWQQRASMHNSRWYPTLTLLSDGRLLASGGSGGTMNEVEIYNPGNNMWTQVAIPAFDLQMPLYPFMFVLPDGNVFFAGGEGSAEGESVGRVLVLNAGPPAWSIREYAAGISGGSAVQYSPGRFMKSGGGNAPTSRTQWIDMTGNYLSADRDWEELPGTEGDMLEPRHFHQLTLLPDGRVTATGGNWLGNSEGVDLTANACDSPPGSGNLINQIPCDSDDDCPTLSCSGPAADHDGDRLSDPIRTCNPRNNACYAQRSAEIWDPETKLWAPCDEGDAVNEDNPRMYHSTAVLLRDGSVISMGGGQRGGLTNQYNAQVYRPPYGVGLSPVLDLPPGSTSVAYGESFNVSVYAATPAAFHLMRPGSVTHSFNMDQRLVPILDFEDDGVSSFTLEAPSLAGAAPPGWYMLFAVSNTGAISEGQYLEINSQPPVEWICAQGTALTVKEKGCLPTAGPTCGGATNDVTLLPPSLGGSLRGWAVQTPAGAVLNPASPTADELAYLTELCQQACAIEWQNEPGVVATCTAPNAFAALTTRAPTGSVTEQSVIDAYAHGEGVWPSIALGCDLDSSCCTAFDEADCATSIERATPAGGLLGRGEAYRSSWNSSTSNLKLITNNGTWTRTLTGSAGFSPCRDGNATAPCPFYLGSMTAAISSAVTPTATCSDGSSASFNISAISFSLSQPAIGIAKTATSERGFPSGGLVMTMTATVGGQTYTRRVPTAKPTKGTQSNGVLGLSNVDSTLVLPCGTGTTTVTARLTLNSGTVTGSPPAASITVPSQVTCGVPRTLTATVSDPNNDIASTRWLVDGVLLASSVTSVTFTGTHELAVRVRDARGGTTTAKKVVSCL